MNNSFYYGSRGSDFKSFVNELLKLAGLNENYITELLTENNMKIFGSVFTASSVDVENNYEFFEQLGDATGGKFIVDYMYNRFPQLRNMEGVKIVARLKINYGSKQSYSEIAEELEFWPYITSTLQDRAQRKKPLLEDVLEAFLGALEYIIGQKQNVLTIGYSYSYLFLKHIFDKKEISLRYEDLYDPKTRLKELFDDSKQGLGKLVYKYQSQPCMINENLTGNTVTCEIYNNDTKIGEGKAFLKADAEKHAAQDALKNLEKMGYKKAVSEFYKKISSFATEGSSSEPLQERSAFELTRSAREDKKEKKIRSRDDIVQLIMKTCGGDINKDITSKDKAGKYVSTLLVYFCRKRDYRSVKICLELGADVNKEDNRGLFPLDYLCSGGNGCKQKVREIFDKIKELNIIPKIHTDALTGCDNLSHYTLDTK